MQIQTNQLADDLRVVLDRARREASKRHNPYLDVEHLLLGLLDYESGTAAQLLTRYGVDTKALYAQVADAVGMERPNPIEVKDYTRWAKSALDRAAQTADSLGQSTLDSRTLLLGLMGETSGAVHDTLAGASISADDVAADLRATPPARPSIGAGSIPLPKTEKPKADAKRKRNERPTIVIRRGVSQEEHQRTTRYILLGVLLLAAYLVAILPLRTVFVFVFVFVGWMFSLTLHEFSHALVAYLGGDWTVKEKGYLSFNPLKYTHPTLSFWMPLIFLALGGIGLPGGAVYIERHRLRSQWWGAAVSAAGPLSNLLLAFLLALPFLTGVVDTDVIARNVFFEEEIKERDPNAEASDYGLEEKTIWENSMLWSAVALLIMLQVTAFVFNLIPLPPLDGFGVIEPFLDAQTRFQMRQIGSLGLMLLIFALWFIPSFNREFWDFIYHITDVFGLSAYVIDATLRRFMFWR